MDGALEPGPRHRDPANIPARRLVEARLADPDATEAPYSSRAARLQTTVVPDAGHDLNLQPNADDFFDRSPCWFTEFFPLADR
jgi:hypothetical protein